MNSQKSKVGRQLRPRARAAQDRRKCVGRTQVKRVVAPLADVLISAGAFMMHLPGRRSALPAIRVKHTAGRVRVGARSMNSNYLQEHHWRACNPITLMLSATAERIEATASVRNATKAVRTAPGQQQSAARSPGTSGTRTRAAPAHISQHIAKGRVRMLRIFVPYVLGTSPGRDSSKSGLTYFPYFQGRRSWRPHFAHQGSS